MRCDIVAEVALDGTPAGEAEAQATINAGGRREYSQDVQVANPQLWSPDRPHLYQLETEVSVGEGIVDTATTVFGIRSLHFDAETGFLLNGQPIKLKGGCVHHDNGVLGAASYDRAKERKVELHKASGYNTIAVPTTHPRRLSWTRATGWGCSSWTRPLTAGVMGRISTTTT